jgi:hypothetical protein
VDFRFKTFAAEAERRLGFLVSDYGFVGPEITQTEQGVAEIKARYTRGDNVVETKLVLYYMGEEYVTTRLALSDTIEVGTDTAHKGHQMRKALDKQASALRGLLRKFDEQR